jgi:hypothetical protein
LVFGLLASLIQLDLSNEGRIYQAIAGGAVDIVI